MKPLFAYLLVLVFAVAGWLMLIGPSPRPSPRLAGRGRRIYCQCRPPVRSDLRDEPVIIPPGELARLNPKIMGRGR